MSAFRNSKIKLNNKIYRIIFLLLVGICLLSITFSFQYYKKLHSTINDESKNYLKEVTSRIGTNINRIIEDNYAILYTMGTVLETNEIKIFSDILPILQKQEAFWDFESIMLIDDSGKAYDLDKKEIFLTIDDAMLQDILNQEQSMSTNQMINNKESIIFSVPLKNVTIDNKKMVAIAACYNPSSFNQVLSMTSFDEQAYSQIVNKTGTIVIRSSSAHTMKTGYNIFSTLEEAEIDKDSNLDVVKKDISNDKLGQIKFTLDGEYRYMVYTPIQPEEWYLLTFVPVKVINEKSDMLLRSTLLICGLLTVVFAVLIVALICIFNYHKRKLEHIAYIDEVTGGNTIQRFYTLARNHLDTHSNTQYALVYTNIQNFKVLNEQLGRENCDSILKFFYDYLSPELLNYECMGRIAADNFCMLLEFKGEEDLLKRFSEWLSGATQYIDGLHMAWTIPITEFGIYVIDNPSLLFTQMIDRAKMALRESERNIDSKLLYAFYDDKVRHQMFRQKQLEDMMEDSLRNKEFQVYFQPKYHLPEETIGGAEALVRWKSASEGMIFPDEFIPLFEKNGFIIKLDLYVFEEVCRSIQRWTSQGLPIIKISVNCSRVHFRDDNFLSPYIKIAKEYGIKNNQVEIELTESVVLENTKQFTRIIDKIKESGFGCSMDDFGSGYSSLNLIQSIRVDTLKIDKIFFRKICGKSDRTEAVVKSIIIMAKALHMETVAEGIEQREQVEMLKRIGCDYIQGYIFAKPMPINLFEEMAFAETKQFGGEEET